LRNVRQHAGRAAARIRLDWTPGRLVLAVVDDGRGVLAWSSDPAAGGHGLHSLRERVQVYGGELAAGPRTGGGFVLTASLPTTRSPS
jgi:signal transduction histidine kinase